MADTVGKTLAALLEIDEPLRQTELAERSETTLIQALNEGKITSEEFADAIKGIR